MVINHCCVRNQNRKQDNKRRSYWYRDQIFHLEAVDRSKKDGVLRAGIEAGLIGVGSKAGRVL